MTMWRRAATALAQRSRLLAAPALAATAGAAFLVAPRESRCDVPFAEPFDTTRAEALRRKFPNFRLMPQTQQNKAVMTILRDENTGPQDFVFFSDRIIRTLIEEALEEMPHVHKLIKTPTGVNVNGVGWKLDVRRICGVSIVRAGESMETGLRDILRGVKIGKILIQRDEETAKPKLFYSKFPPNIETMKVLLLDPMLATGGSAIAAVDVLVKAGVSADNIVFINLICCPEGIKAMATAHPQVMIVSAALDSHLDSRKYIIPGIGDFGDRYFGTT